MTKIANVSIRFFTVVAFTFATVCLWSITTQAADSRTETTHNADGSATTCKYETDFATARDGAHVIRSAWRCVTSKK